MPPRDWEEFCFDENKSHAAVRRCASELARLVFSDEEPARMRLAAAALYGQPFGVPIEGMRQLRRQILFLAARSGNEEVVYDLEDLLGFIEALLPPWALREEPPPPDRKPNVRNRRLKPV